MNTGSDSAYALLYLTVLAVAYTSTGSTEVITIAVLTVAVAIRRRHPAASLAVAWLGAIVQMALGQQANFLDIAILAVLFAVAAYGTRRVQVLGAASAVLGALIASVYNALTQRIEYFSAGYDGVLAVALMFGVALAVLGLSWTAGALARVLRMAQEGRAGQQRAEDARAAAQRELDAVEERNAIARDMHDVVAHSLAVVIAQADGARYLGTAHPEQTDEALSTISAVARDALGDVRQLLAQLRHSEASGPQPTASDIPALLDSVAASGAGVVRDFGVELATVPRGAGLALFRITQEATTNALRHGVAGSPIRVALRQRGDELVLSVRNRAEPGAVGAGGHGLVGMRERALLAGGSLRAEPDGVDFLVEARLPRIRAEGDPAA
ncbi:sensor histidine kinase [Microbacteriaceae bacterium VKM Ac-2854]|nr:sensor histidine kinase [Microbacteriaceae bacterium VKM Ac-2854]